MNPKRSPIETFILESCGLKTKDFITESEGIEYEACQFYLNHKKVIYRNAKVTPKKTGQFVTFWKRNHEQITAPFDENDPFDFYMIKVNLENKTALFVFPKSLLLDKGIVSTKEKEGKRGFRIYPSWTKTDNKTAEKTQQWQLDYFYSKERFPEIKNMLETSK